MNRFTKLSILAILCAGGVLAACRVKTEGTMTGPGTGGGEGTGGGDGQQADYGGGSYGGGAYGAGVVVEVIKDDSGREYKVQQGVKGAPGEVGCADGQREAFVDRATFPGIAGCLAAWQGTPSLRTPPSGTACGDDLGPCPGPGDACAPGWHVCGASGATADLKQVTDEQCEHAGGGRFSAGLSHCTAQQDCKYDHSAGASYPCFESGWCSEPVCCGDDCGEFGACTDGIWDKKTHIPVGTDQGCGRASSARAGGILCCK